MFSMQQTKKNRRENRRAEGWNVSEGLMPKLSNTAEQKQNDAKTSTCFSISRSTHRTDHLLSRRQYNISIDDDHKPEHTNFQTWNVTEAMSEWNERHIRHVRVKKVSIQLSSISLSFQDMCILPRKKGKHGRAVASKKVAKSQGILEPSDKATEFRLKLWISARWGMI